MQHLISATEVQANKYPEGEKKRKREKKKQWEIIEEKKKR